MKKLINVSLMALGVLLFAGTLLLNFNLKVSDALATEEVKCYIRTTSDCPETPLGGGGQRVTCDTTGDFKSGETCTPVTCIWGTSSKLSCEAPGPVE